MQDSKSSADVPKLDEREEHFFIPGPGPGLWLFLRYRASTSPFAAGRRAVIYVHGATFPSGLSVAHRMDGRSWRDALNDAGFDVWALDFQGFGASDPYPQMSNAADAGPPLGLTDDAVSQLEAAVRFILEHQGLSAVSLVAHSWGGMVAGRLACDHPTLVDRLVLFAPIARREPSRYMPRPDVVFEVHPGEGKKEEYLGHAKELKPLLESVDKFFESRRREGWVLSLATWRDEKTVVRWRTVGRHHRTQAMGVKACLPTIICGFARSRPIRIHPTVWE